MQDDDFLEISFEDLGNGKWERAEDDPDDPELEIVKIVKGGPALYTQISKLKARGWKVREGVNPAEFNGFILYKERSSEDPNT